MIKWLPVAEIGQFEVSPFALFLYYGRIVVFSSGGISLHVL